MFDVNRFIEQCKDAISGDGTHQSVCEIVRGAISDPQNVLKELGEPNRAGVETIYHSNDLTILNVMWGPRMTIHPHNHLMWAVIGVYEGQEDNTFYKRVNGGIEIASQQALMTKDAAPLGEPVIHSVTNPLDKITAAIHVYGGDFFDMPRSEWDPRSLDEHPYDVEHTRRVFEESNRLLEA
jgi:predicted metal-dependent enzyme (double-stranded beta helix superfamily)